MTTAVAIHLDYLLCSDSCEKAWKVLYTAFLEAGYELHERLFIQALPYSTAAPLAEAAIRQAAEELQEQNIALADVLRSRLAFEYHQLDMLDIPRTSNKGIEVQFMDRFFSQNQGLS